MIFFLCVSLIVLLGGTVAYLLRRVVAISNELDRRDAPAIQPKTPTHNERWMQEQEHILNPAGARRDFNHTDCRVCGPGPLKNGQVPSEFTHVFYSMQAEHWEDGYGHRWSTEERKPCSPSDAEFVSSQIEGRKTHTVMVDIDMPARLVESSTPGHHHLYVDLELSWRKYRLLLWAMQHVGLIEKGYYKASRNRKATHLRPPWKEKQPV